MFGNIQSVSTNLDTTRVLKLVHSSARQGVASTSKHKSGLDHAIVQAGDHITQSPAMMSAFARVQNRLNLQPAPIGHRYAIIRSLGAGGCGQVFLAYDAELDRKVALKKILRPHRDQDILVHEARLLAKLRHPNIVTVYDIQVLPSLTGRISQYIIMEYIEGCSLRAWLGQKKRSRSEILRVLGEAGQGLAAAHAAGIIHRDFKPENVLVDREGRARVLDFGLSQTQEISAASELHETRDDDATTTLTQITGTPAYMAPERYFNSEGSVASDIFSFGVTLWEALAGQRPFSAKTIPELQFQIISGQCSEVPTVIPRHIAQVLRRCLANAPEARFPAMEPVLEALARDPWPRRRRWVAGLLLAICAGVTGSLLGPNAHANAPCAGIEDQFATWNDEQATTLRATILASDTPYANDTWERLDTKLDHYADTIRESAKDACEAGLHYQRTSNVLADRRLACLHAREIDLNAFIDSLATGDTTAVEHAVQAFEALTPISRCDADVLLADRTTLPDPGIAADVEVLRTDLARVKAMGYAGRAREVLDLADTAISRAESLEYAPVIAEAHLRRGHLFEAMAEFERAEPDYQAAWWTALGSEHDTVAREAANHLASMLSTDPTRANEARTWSDNGEAVATRMGIDDGHRSYRLRTLARLAENEGNFEQAVKNLQEATQSARSAYGPDAWRAVIPLNHLSYALMNLGDIEAATQASDQAIARGRAALGDEHPDLSEIYRQRSNLSSVKGEYQAAQAASRRAVEIVEAAYGSKSRRLAPSLYALGTALCELGEEEEGLRQFDRGLEILVPSLGREHVHVLFTYHNRADCLRSLKRYDEAQQIYDENLEISQRQLGDDHTMVATTHIGLGELALLANEATRARQHFQRALEIREAKSGSDHKSLIPALVGLAEVDLMQGNTVQARNYAERAQHLQEQARNDIAALARPRFALARALVDVPGQRTEALELATMARQGYESRMPRHNDQVKNVSAWIATHTRGRSETSVTSTSGPDTTIDTDPTLDETSGDTDADTDADA